MVHRRHGRHVARHRSGAGRRAVADVLAHAARAHVTTATAAAADVRRAGLTARRRTVTCAGEKTKASVEWSACEKHVKVGIFFFFFFFIKQLHRKDSFCIVKKKKTKNILTINYNKICKRLRKKKERSTG